MRTFLEKFFFNDGLQVVCIGSVHAAEFHRNAIEVERKDTDVFFGPAMRKSPGNEKKDVLGTRVLWVDADNPAKPLCTLPPTLQVFSGHGWHLYWMLAEPITDIELIERLNQILAADVPTADKACWNANRFLRVPGTRNTKEPPANVELRFDKPYVYTPEDFLMLDRLDKATKHKIRTGDSRGYRSRSERDWAVIVALIRAGATDVQIGHLFATQPVGEKLNEANGPKYLETTLAKARASKAVTASGKGFEESEDGYLRATSKGMKRVSTFIFHPKLLLDGSGFQAEDAIVGDIEASGYTWEDQTFTRSAFTSVAKLDRETPVAAWQWLGRDEDVRALLPFLLSQLQEAGFPKVSASPTLGLHFTKGVPYFVGTSQVLGSKSMWKGFEGPLAWLPSKREHPELELAPTCDQAGLTLLGSSLPKLNDPGPLWAMLGWYAASCLKPWLESKGYRFPILNVVGTKGSGKTTLIQRVFMPLFGQKDPKSYDAGTTRFVTLALLGSSNAVPIAFSEFRFESVEKFIRYILLAYDTGHDPRGRGDQTTVDYPLSAPFSVDGEDMIDDPAARERVVVAHLHPGTVAEGTEAYRIFNELRSCLPPGFGGFYIQRVLALVESGKLDKMLEQCRAKVFEAFPNRLPDRVRNNHIVAYLGAVLWCNVVGITPPEASVMESSISSVYDMETGRARTLSDSLVEDVVNACAQGQQAFRWRYEKSTGILWFQLSSAHTWWVSNRRRQGRGALERDAIKAQLKETPYVVGPKVIADTWLYGVNLSQAQGLGLDIPSALSVGEITFKFGG